MKRSDAVRVATTPACNEERRAFCKATGVAIAGAAILPALPGCGGSGGGGGGGATQGGTVQADMTAAMLQINDVDEIREDDAIVDVCRDANGIYAISAYCTHAHCIVEVNPNDTNATPSFLCPCHGSTYDYNGENQTAPAPAPLPHYKVTVDASGNIFIDTNTIVDASTRVKV